MTIQLPPDLETFVRSEVANGHFASEDAAVAGIVRDYFERKKATADPKPSLEPNKPVWERILERTAHIPEEEWNQLPPDLAPMGR